MTEQISDLKAVEQLNDAYNGIRKEIAKVIIGQDKVIEQLLIALLSSGHCLLVGVPGLAKTLLISTLAQVLDLKFNRIQFTPDLMPSDITGTEIIEEDKSTGNRQFKFVKGPVFANAILADEINRYSAKNAGGASSGHAGTRSHRGRANIQVGGAVFCTGNSKSY